MIISEVVKKGWAEAKKSFWFFVGLLIIYFAIVIVASLLLNKIKYVGQIISFLLSFYLSVGLIIISLKKARGQTASIGDLFAGFPFLASYAGASILYMFIVIAGMILLIFPGVIWSLKYMFYPYLIVDKNMKAVESLKASAKITEGSKWDLLGINFVIGVISMLGVLCLVIGMFWTIPLSMIAQALVYMKFAEKL
ncbi:MAG: hypothetical protein PHF84_00225 [bacterium]|nr:hypothetical protein [bacterium]